MTEVEQDDAAYLEALCRSLGLAAHQASPEKQAELTELIETLIAELSSK
jgi:hypothetical protein